MRVACIKDRKTQGMRVEKEERKTRVISDRKTITAPELGKSDGQ